MNLLVVGDSRSSLAAIMNAMKAIGCTVHGCLHSRETMQQCQTEQFDLIIIDYAVPKMNGIELVAALREMEPYRLVPIIMITPLTEAALRVQAIKVGTTDLLTKPFDRVELQARARNLLALRRAQIELTKIARHLASEVHTITFNLARREEEIVWRLARAMELRDGTTSSHISRVAEIARLIALGLGLGEDRARIIYLAAPLHDVGKIAIPDKILQKPGRLGDEEVQIMRRHVQHGMWILEDGCTDLTRVAAIIAGTHHERWDGSGYPYGLAGDDIPLEGRIVSVADVFDALCSERPYKPAWLAEQAYEEIVRCSGSHFDPACVEAFRSKWRDILSLMNG
ncbi:HD domain-containing protein [Mesorhizobium sp. B2-4-15]|nr:HD domain-containing phosphohydrolase [Mesorhizobium sp. B2-4-15]TPK67520.1 HD domain-containing protein [Mesorhizobium sp. B2-4-15]